MQESSSSRFLSSAKANELLGSLVEGSIQKVVALDSDMSDLINGPIVVVALSICSVT